MALKGVGGPRGPRKGCSWGVLGPGGGKTERGDLKKEKKKIPFCLYDVSPIVRRVSVLL